MTRIAFERFYYAVTREIKCKKLYTLHDVLTIQENGKKHFVKMLSYVNVPEMYRLWKLPSCTHLKHYWQIYNKCYYLDN